MLGGGGGGGGGGDHYVCERMRCGAVNYTNPPTAQFIRSRNVRNDTDFIFIIFPGGGGAMVHACIGMKIRRTKHFKLLWVD